MISGNIRAEILTGSIQQGDKLPSEAEISAQYAVSRMTARHAITELVNQNLVNRVQGRGAFVIGNKIERRMRAFGSFHEDMVSRGLNPTSKTIVREMRKCSPREARLLSVRKNETILSIERIRYANGVPLGLQKLVIPHNFAGLMQEIDLDKISFYTYLRDEGMPIVKANQRIEAVNDRETAQKLSTDPEAPFLKLEKVSFIDDGHAVEFLTSIFRGDKFAFDMDLTE